MSIIDRFIDTFDHVPRDEPLSRIGVVPQGQELPETTIERLHSDHPLTKRDRHELRQWAEAHGYDPDLLAEEKRLRMVEDCEHLNHRPISEHWQVECSDTGVTVPDTVAGWQRTNSSEYRIPMQWLNNGDTVAITGLYGHWTVTADGSTVATDQSAAEAVEAAQHYMTRHTDQGQRPQTGSEETQSEFWQNLREMAAEGGISSPDPPDWFEPFPEKIDAYEREERVWRGKPCRLIYAKHVPEQSAAVDVVTIQREADTDQFVCFQLEEFGLNTETVRSKVFRRTEASSAANDLWSYLHTGTVRKEREADTTPLASPDPPDWFDTFPTQIGEFDRGEIVETGAPPHLTYYRQVPDRHVPVDMVRITHEDGIFIAREQVNVYGRLRWQDTPESVVFQREETAVAADALTQYLLDGVEPDTHYDPDPAQPWPPEDLFSEDTA